MNNLKTIAMKFIFLLLFGLMVSCSCESQNFFGSHHSGTDFSEGLQNYYKMDGTTGNMIDEINSNDFTVTGVSRGNTGLIGDCYYFDGTTSYCSNGTPPVSQLSGDSVTIAMWVQFDTLSAAQTATMYFWFDYTTVVEQVGVQMFKSATTNYDHITGGVSYRNGRQGVTVSLLSLQEDIWYLAVTRVRLTGTNAPFIASVDKESATGNRAGTYPDWTTGTTYVGRTNTSSWFQGYIDDIAVWDYWLTDTQVSEYIRQGQLGKPIKLN
jgi:hypothetical protein